MVAVVVCKNYAAVNVSLSEVVCTALGLYVLGTLNYYLVTYLYCFKGACINKNCDNTALVDEIEA